MKLRSYPVKLLLGGLALLLVLLSGILYGFRENLVYYSLNPRTPYQTYAPPAVPDYTKPEAWAALPERPGQAELRPQGVSAADGDRPIDTFYIHPTTYYDSTHWNGPIDDREAQLLLDETALAIQVSAFNEVSLIYAPRYRQATLYASFTRNQDGRMARQTAYKDVSRAFRYYLRQFNNDRPFVIVGYGQGALHGIRLLQEHVVGKDAQSRLVGAYLIGFPFPIDLFDLSLNTLSICDTPQSVSCIVSWNEIQYGRDPGEAKDRTLVWNILGRLVSTQGRQLACVNPLTWSSDELPAPNPLNSGGVVVTNTGSLSSPVREITGAQCRDGVLYVDKPADSRFRRLNWPGSHYRLADYNLFYMNIRSDVSRRLAIWSEQNGARRALGSLSGDASPQ
ncbi:MAG: DUF3089 domain-containing protein [Alphaproteobacteria bacterium]|nr:MAG: DUF3089 domain-containing protein [Alphaproteobacteria bacterium]